MNKDLQAIRSLERAYGVKLALITNLKDNDIGYSLDEADRVVALSLYKCQIIDLMPLTTLTSLTKLYLADNKITDITPLATCVFLTKLDLHLNQIADIAPLSALTRLTDLDLENNRVIDIAPLSTLVELKLLGLENNRIIHIAPLSALEKLTSLYLNNNQLIEVAPLAALTQLDFLNLSNNNIRSLPRSFLQFSLDWQLEEYAERGLLLKGNPLWQPPPEVIKNGRQIIEQYYQYLEKENVKELHEGKLILIGEPDAGKSSIVRRLLYNEIRP